MSMQKATSTGASAVRYPGIPVAVDGSEAVVHAETLASEAAGAYPITPSTQMGEGWAVAVAQGRTNAYGRRLIFFEPEGEHAAAGVTAGMSMVGLRSTNFSSGQGIAYMHESLYAAAGKRLTYVLNVAARAMTKHALNVHAGHDDYHAVDDTGFFQLFAKDVQEIADFTLIAHRIAELGLTPGISAQDGFLTSHVIETVLLPEPELVREYLGDPSDTIESPTPAQRLVFGETRRRIPELFDLDYPALLGSVQNQDAYAQGVAAQRPFYFDHIRELTDRAFDEYAALTGRRYARVQGHRTEDADYVLVGQGTVVANAEAVADYLRETEGLKVGVLNVSMFRPFPCDLVSRHLAGKSGVVVLERVDQPLAADAPLLREIRTAMGQATENHRAARATKRLRFSGADPDPVTLPYPGVACVAADDVPDFYSAGFGFGSRDLQPGDLVAAVRNLLPGGRGRRQYYLGVDFIRRGTRLPKLQIWQEQLQDAYPDIAERALESAGDFNLLPADTLSLRIHSVGGWGAITTGKNLGLTAFELFGLHVKANPKYGSEKKGQPTTFYATLSRERVRLNAELKHVNVVLSPDGNVFRHSNPLAGIEPGGVFVIQSDQEPAEVWRTLPDHARRTITEKGIRVWALDGFGIASEEATDPELRYRMQGAAFMGAFFRASPLLEREGMDEEALFEGIRERLEAKFGSKGQQVVDDNYRVIRRGWTEARTVPTEGTGAGDSATAAPGARLPVIMSAPDAAPGLGDPGRFFEQVCSLCAVRQDGIADPFAAIGVIPAATSAVRDMTDIRFEVPDFVAERCTGCSQCWIQCPDAAIPGLVNTVEDLIDHAVRHTANGASNARIRQVQKHLAKETRKVLEAVEFTTFGDALKTAYGSLVERLGWDAGRRAELDGDFARVYSLVSDFPLARTVPFWDVPERKEKGAGGLLSVTINPEACKGCNICVDVCPEDALVTVRQDEGIVERLRRNWDFWEALPDTDDRYVNVRDLDEGIGVLSSLLLKKDTYRSMAGGDGACMGCGEKTAVHLVTSTIEAVMQPRVKGLVTRIDGLVDELEAREREIVASAADLEAAAREGQGPVEVDVSPELRRRLQTLARARGELQDLRWRYTAGPSGKGRAPVGITNSTGCSSVWGSTYPYNPYPFPWVNHLFQDAPSIAIGIFEGHMRKMADAFVSIRRAEKLVDGSYDPDADESFFGAFGWEQFSDEEFKLCPPILAIGGDGAMLDIGFQNLSRLMASGKPIRVLILDTQVYSNTGGQACTSGFTGQVADMSAWGKAQHGKTEVRKELSFIALAHRGVFVHQSSQALASHLIEGVIRGLNSRRPAIFNIYTPCPVEHGLADDWAPTAAKLALEARAFPFLTYDPDGGATLSECLSLDGNPAPDDTWPTYELKYVTEDGEDRAMELPLTIADWAATESRFRKHFELVDRAAWADDQIPFHEFVELDADARDGRTPFIWTVGSEGRLDRLIASKEMVFLAEERLHFWHQLREMAGLDVPARARGVVARDLELEFESKLAGIRSEYEARIHELKSRYPRVVARRMAEGLLRFGADRRIADVLKDAESAPGLEPIGAAELVEPEAAGGSRGNGAAGEGTVGTDAADRSAQAAGSRSAAATAEAPAPDVVAVDGGEGEDALRMEPWIDTPLCTSCNDCININAQMFAYDENKQAYIADAGAGTYAQLVQAAEKCPAAIIHPGDPLDPDEPGLEKWIQRAEALN